MCICRNNINIISYISSSKLYNVLYSSYQTIFKITANIIIKAISTHVPIYKSILSDAMLSAKFCILLIISLFCSFWSLFVCLLLTYFVLRQSLTQQSRLTWNHYVVLTGFKLTISLALLPNAEVADMHSHAHLQCPYFVPEHAALPFITDTTIPYYIFWNLCILVD